MSSIIIKIHEKQLYTSAQRTLYELRTVYRVLKGWRDVRKVVGRCLDCRKINSKTDTVATVALPKVFRFSLQPKWIEIIFVKSKNQLCYFNNLCYNMLFWKFCENWTIGLSPSLFFCIEKIRNILYVFTFLKVLSDS